MPTYEYECTACGHTMEAFQAITEGPLRKCPKCKKLRLRRLIGTGAAIIFRGSGFYETDHRSDDYKSKAKLETSGTTSSSSDAKSGPKSDSKTESTPKGKTESKKKGDNGKD